jgi:hypothetical protein
VGWQLENENERYIFGWLQAAVAAAAAAAGIRQKKIRELILLVNLCMNCLKFQRQRQRARKRE